MSEKSNSLKNPLQLLGLFLVFMETAASVGLFAILDYDHWTKDFLIFAMGLGIVGFIFVAGFVNIYLTIRKPHFLFNPSDYHKDVQVNLFDSGNDIEIPEDVEVPEDVDSST